MKKDPARLIISDTLKIIIIKHRKCLVSKYIAKNNILI